MDTPGPTPTLVTPSVPLKLPSMFEMAFNLSDTLKEVLDNAVKNGTVLAPDDVVKERMDTCWKCDLFLPQPAGSVLAFRCSKCGCGMKFKTRLLVAKCPDVPPRWKR